MAENAQPHRKADPELLRQLDAAEARAERVEAVFILRRPAGSTLEPDQVERLAGQLVERVQVHAGVRVEDVNVFKNMGAFVVAGNPTLVRLLLDQPEIETGIANRQSGSVDLLGAPAVRKGRTAGGA